MIPEHALPPEARAVPTPEAPDTGPFQPLPRAALILLLILGAAIAASALTLRKNNPTKLQE